MEAELPLAPPHPDLLPLEKGCPASPFRLPLNIRLVLLAEVAAQRRTIFPLLTRGEGLGEVVLLDLEPSRFVVSNE
jgi:hypothetical protein